MKSMKEIADELNVTKMTVYNNAKKANVQFQKVDNVNYLSIEDETIVVNRIRKNQNKHDDFENEKKEEVKVNSDNLIKDETIKHLYNQLDIYIEQSNRDKEQINTLNRLLENQQILALESNKKIQRLENQLEEERQLNYNVQASGNDKSNVEDRDISYNKTDEKDNDQKETQYTDIVELSAEDNEKSNDVNKSEEREPKKGFWGRLFGR